MAPTDEERQDKAPMTGAMSLHDVLRHLVHYGPARNDAERAELLAAVNDDDPDAPEPDEAPLSDAEKIREYDRLQRQQKAAAPAERPAEPFPGTFPSPSSPSSSPEPVSPSSPSSPSSSSAPADADTTGGNA